MVSPPLLPDGASGTVLGGTAPGRAWRVCGLKDPPATRMCNRKPIRLTGCPRRRRSIDGMARCGGIDHGDRAAALHLERVVGADEGGGVLVQPDADGERVVGQRGDQPAEPVALAEVLVDDEAVGQPQARARARTLSPRRRGPSSPKRDHVLAQDAAPALVPPTARRRRCAAAAAWPRGCRRASSRAATGCRRSRTQPWPRRLRPASPDLRHRCAVDIA